uniref:Laminin EGF-like domain-containing protein n=1 Tax=Amphimedon queenslandica TaxID=400682 RepID=A0A1X7TEN9_AMPQE
MTSFQRMVLVAAVLFMITAHVTDALTCHCYPQRKCEGNYEEVVEGDGRECCTKGYASHACYDSVGVICDHC